MGRSPNLFSAGMPAYGVPNFPAGSGCLWGAAQLVGYSTAGSPFRRGMMLAEPGALGQSELQVELACSDFSGFHIFLDHQSTLPLFNKFWQDRWLVGAVQGKPW